MLQFLRPFLVLVFLFPIIQGTSQTTRLDVLSSDQGLSQGMVYDIMQDRTGFLWFATRDGLNRYDGYEFKVFKTDPFNQYSISDNVIKVLYEDHLGRIWLGTETNGVDVFDPVTERFYHLSKGVNGLPDQNVNAIAETPDGAMWIGTQMGLSRVVIPTALPMDNPDLSVIAQSEHFFWEEGNTSSIRPNMIVSLVVTDDGMIWVGTARDAYRFDAKTRQSKLLPLKETGVEDLNQIPNLFVKGRDGSIWLGQKTRVVHISGNKTTIFPLPNATRQYSAFLTFDLDGNLFVSRRKEIYLFSKKVINDFENGLTSENTPSSQVFCTFPEKDIIGSTKMLCDRRGLIWIGTNGYGVRRYNPVNRLFQHALAGVSTRKIRPNDKGELWVWTSDGYFSFLDKKHNLITRRLIEDKTLFHQDCIFAQDGSIWLLAQVRGGKDDNSVLIKKDPQSGTLQTHKNLISASMYSQLMDDSKGNIWLIGSKSDLVKFDPVTKTTKNYDLSIYTGFKEYAFSLIEDSNKHIWVGTPHGLVRGIPQNNREEMSFSIFRNIPTNVNSLNNNSILGLQDDLRDPGHFLWVGTRGGGLNLMNKITGDCKHYTEADGLPNDVIYGILPDGMGNLWLSTNSGLSKLDPQTEHFENYFATDGLQDNEFNTISFAKAHDGNLVFGGVNGLTIFDPTLINPINSTPPVRITALKIQNKMAIPGGGILEKAVDHTQEVTFRYDQNTFTLEFAALDFSTPNKNQFRYRLLGAHDEWSEATTNHSTTYSNLPPGEYTFELVTGGAHGMWTGAPARLGITILAPWWRSNLAYGIYLLLLGWLVWEIYRFQIRRIQLQEQLAFEHREAERIRALEQMKADFFSNITHELRTPLTLILEPLRQILNNPDAENWLPKVRIAESNSHMLLQLVNQLLDLAKLEGGAMHPDFQRGQVADVLKSVGQSFAEIIKSKNIAFQCAPSGGRVEAFDFDAEKLRKIASNLLSNALKFTPPGGKVDMTWHSTPDNWFVLDVCDTGPGIAQEDLPRIFDRFYSKANSPEQAQISTGIGLALCRELAELLGGRIEVKSDPVAGSDFRLHLPIVGSLQNQQANVTASNGQRPVKSFAETNVHPDANVLPEPETQGKKARTLLLLAEDNHELRYFLAQTLSEKFEVIEAVDGQEALELSTERTPDIIVSDLMMPRLDGLGLLDALKNDFRTSHIPVVLLTAKTALENRIKGLEHGADAYLGKPFQTQELFAWLENLLESRRHLQQKFAHPKMSQGAVDNSSEQPEVGPSAPETKLGLLDRQFIVRIREVMEAEIDNDRITPEDIARQLAMSRSQLYRKLSAITGLSATEYLRNYRLDRAFELLKDGAGNVSEVAWRVGFVNAKHFSTSFKERFGKSPSEV